MKQLFKRLGALVGAGVLLASVSVIGVALPASANYTNITCSTAWLDPHRPLTNGDHINIDVVQAGNRFQVNTQVDRNISGGYDTLGLRIKKPGGEIQVPLTEAEVKSGQLTFNFGQYLSGAYTVEWAQFNHSYFNQNRDPKVFLKCGEPPVTVTEVVPVNPTVTAGVGSCVDGEWTVSPSVLTFTPVKNGEYSINGIDFSANPGPYNLPGSETTISFRAVGANVKLGPIPAGWIPFEGVYQTTVTPISVEPEDCTTVVPPAVCTEQGGPYTEGDDTAPVKSYLGYTFTGGSGEAVGLRFPTDGNLQGVSASYVASGTGMSQFYYRIVLDLRADGGSEYKSVTVTSGSPVTQDSVAYFNGSNRTLASIAEEFPNNKVVSVGFHLDSAASADAVVLLTEFTSPCAVLDFTEPKTPEPEAKTETKTETFVNCASRMVDVVTSTRTTGPATFDPTTNTWTEGEFGEWIVTDTETRDATNEECPVVIPPVVEPPVVEPPVNAPVVADNPKAPALAVTGGADLTWLLPVGLVGIVGGLILLLVRRKRA